LTGQNLFLTGHCLLTGRYLKPAVDSLRISDRYHLYHGPLTVIDH